LIAKNLKQFTKAKNLDEKANSLILQEEAKILEEVQIENLVTEVIIEKTENAKINLIPVVEKNLDFLETEKVAQNQFTQAKQATLLCIKNKFVKSSYFKI
jgi:hypothetical protein